MNIGRNHERLPPAEGVVPLEQIQGDDEQDTLLLKEMAAMAVRYVRSYEWCLDLKAGYFGDGIGGVIGIFLFLVSVRGFDEDKWIWVFMGELPSAYLMVGEYTNPRLALEKYLDGLQEWADAAEAGKSLQDLIPIELPPTPEIILKARNTIDSLRKVILPNIRFSG